MVKVEHFEEGPGFNQVFDHPGAMSEVAQIAAYIAMMTYMNSYMGCIIFRDTFYRQVMVIFQTIKLFLIVAGLLPHLLHCQALFVAPNVRKEMFPALVVSLFLFNIFFPLFVAFLVIEFMSWSYCDCRECRKQRREKREKREKPHKKHNARRRAACGRLCTKKSCSSNNNVCKKASSGSHTSGSKKACKKGFWDGWTKPHKSRDNKKCKGHGDGNCGSGCHSCGMPFSGFCRRPWKKKPKCCSAT